MDQLAVLAVEVAPATNAVAEAVRLDGLAELTSLELSLVGGGQASMAFY